GCPPPPVYPAIPSLLSRNGQVREARELSAPWSRSKIPKQLPITPSRLYKARGYLYFAATQFGHNLRICLRGGAMNLRKAAIGVVAAGGMTIGLAVGFGPRGARDQPSGSPPQPGQQPFLQQANLTQQTIDQTANPFAGLNSQQVSQSPSLINKLIP